MITGVITAEREATIHFPVRGQNGREQEVRAIIDTGFNGCLTLPESLVSTLGLSYHSQVIVTLGDGSDRNLSTYEASVRRLRCLRRITVRASLRKGEDLR